MGNAVERGRFFFIQLPVLVKKNKIHVELEWPFEEKMDQQYEIEETKSKDFFRNIFLKIDFLRYFKKKS